MRVVLIANPQSGRGRALVAARVAQAVFRARGWETETRLTRCAGDATRLAREAARAGCEAVFVCGGDGSLSQAVTGLLDSGIPAGVIPAGTGNDFARTVNLSRDPRTACEQLLAGGPRDVDLLEVNGGALWCINVMGAGFDARVCKRMSRRSRLLGGLLAYLVAVAQEFVAYRPTEVKVCVDGAEWEGEALLVAIANARSYGAGMMIAPQAAIDDGLLDVVLVEHVGRLDFLRSFPLVLKGAHLTHPAVRTWRGKEALVSAPSAQPVLVDGDLQCETPVRVRVCPGRARVWLPGQVAAGSFM